MVIYLMNNKFQTGFLQTFCPEIELCLHLVQETDIFYSSAQQGKIEMRSSFAVPDLKSCLTLWLTEKSCWMKDIKNISQIYKYSSNEQ